MNNKNITIFLIMAMLLVQASVAMSMEDSYQTIPKDVLNNEMGIESLPNEVMFCVVKELIKFFIDDFIVSEEVVDPEKIVPIKSLRLISKAYKFLIDKNKKILLLCSLRELFPLEFGTLNKDKLNNKFSKILSGQESRENEIKAALLLMAGADSNPKIDWIPDVENQIIRQDYALIIICIRGNFKHLINVLSRYGANVNNVDTLYGSPLIAATQNDQAEIIEILLNNGADINIKHNGLTALDIANDRNNQQIINLIAPTWLISKFFKSFVHFSQSMLCQSHAYA